MLRRNQPENIGEYNKTQGVETAEVVGNLICVISITLGKEESRMTFESEGLMVVFLGLGDITLAHPSEHNLK